MAGHLNFSDDIGVHLREQPRIATTRMRKAFRYPSEDSDEDVPLEGIDEEGMISQRAYSLNCYCLTIRVEQEAMIQKLSARDATSTKVYQAVFLVVPLFATVVYTPSLVAPDHSSEFFRSVIAITSLLASAYMLYCVPIDGWQNPANAGAQVKGIPDTNGPLGKYIGYLNGGLGAVLALGAYSAWRKGNEGAVWLGIIPGGKRQHADIMAGNCRDIEMLILQFLSLVVLILVLFLRIQLRPVDFSELEALRYRYKGA